MKCEIYYNDELIAGPLLYSQDMLRDICAARGINPDMVPPVLRASANIGGFLQVIQVVENKPPLERGEEYGNWTRRDTGSVVVLDYEVRGIDTGKLAKQRLLEAKVAFKELLEGRFEFRGVMIRANAESVTTAMSQLSFMEKGWVRSLIWRGKVPVTPSLSGDFSNANVRKNIEIDTLKQMEELCSTMVTRNANCHSALSMAEDEITTALLAGDRNRLVTINPRAQLYQLVN